MQFIRYRRRSYAADSANLLSNCYLAALPTADTLLKPILRLQNMFDNTPIETSNWKDLNLLHASFTRYDTSSSPIGYAYPGRTKLINLQAPSSSFSPAVVSGNTIAKDSRYLDESIYSFSNGNPLAVTPHSGVTKAYIWDYLNKEPVAKVTNAAQSDIAFTSFEATGLGNWTFAGSPVTDTTAPTGSKCYYLPNGNITKSGLSSGTAYIISYWIKGSTALSISGTQSGYPVQGKTINGWTYFEHKVTGLTSVTISGSYNIDELRLYPSTAQMTTYTYAPLVGMTTECDVDNRITYYFYDWLGRLAYVKDQDKNVIKTINYHYANTNLY